MIALGPFSVDHIEARLVRIADHHRILRATSVDRPPGDLVGQFVDHRSRIEFSRRTDAQGGGEDDWYGEIAPKPAASPRFHYFLHCFPPSASHAGIAGGLRCHASRIASRWSIALVGCRGFDDNVSLYCGELFYPRALVRCRAAVARTKSPFSLHCSRPRSQGSMMSRSSGRCSGAGLSQDKRRENGG